MDNTAYNRAAAYKMLVIESLVTVFAVLVLYTAVDIGMARSVAVGGLAFIAPNAWFAKYVFRYSAAESAHLAIRWFYIGEMIKIFVTVLIFALAFLWAESLNVAALFTTYIVMLVINIWGNSILMAR